MIPAVDVELWYQIKKMLGDGQKDERDYKIGHGL